MVDATPELKLMAPTTINITCFRYEPDPLSEEDLRALNTEIMLRLQEAGIAAISDTTVAGRHSLRVAICNHRTRTDDLEILVREVLRIGAEVAAGTF